MSEFYALPGERHTDEKPNLPPPLNSVKTPVLPEPSFIEQIGFHLVETPPPFVGAQAHWHQQVPNKNHLLTFIYYIV